MKIELGKLYQTRDGRKVRIICVDAVSDRPIVGLVTTPFEFENSQTYDQFGFWLMSHEARPLDLVSEWEEPRRYVTFTRPKFAVYITGGGTYQLLTNLNYCESKEEWLKLNSGYLTPPEWETKTIDLGDLT